MNAEPVPTAIQTPGPTPAPTPPRPPPDAAFVQKLVESCQGLVYSQAWQWRQRVGRQVDLDDLIAYGQVALLEAAYRFDPGRGVQFITFAFERVRGSMRDGLRQMGFRPADVEARRYARLAREVFDGESPTPVGSSGTPGGDTAGWFTDLGARLTVVYLASSIENEDGQGLDGMADSDGPSPEAEAELGEARSMLRELITELPRQEQELVRGLYFEGVCLVDVAERLGINKSWASRLHQRALRDLASGLRRRGLPANV